MKFDAYKDKWAIVLGASSGFGAAAARAWAKAGLNIVGIHLDRKATLPLVESLKTDLEAEGVKNSFFLTSTLLMPNKDKKCLESIKADCEGKIQCLLHSLAFGSLKPFIDEESKKYN